MKAVSQAGTGHPHHGTSALGPAVQFRDWAAHPTAPGWVRADLVGYQPLVTGWQSYYKAHCNFMPCFLLPWSAVSALFVQNEQR